MPLQANDVECQLERIPYLPPATVDTYSVVVESIGLPASIIQDNELEFCKVPQIWREEGYPVIIFSPGFSVSRLLSSAQAQSLASQGYIIITVDHPYEATVVEFPDGEVVYGFNQTDASDKGGEEAVKVRTEDVFFIIDQLQRLCALSGNHFFPKEVFVYGHSLGGATAALAAFKDDRVAGGINFDGTIYGPVKEAGLGKPFILAGPPIKSNDTKPYNGFMDKLRGPKMLVTVEATEHMSFMDAPLLVALRDDIPQEYIPAIQASLGTIDGKRLAHVVDEILSEMASFLFKDDSERLCRVDEEFSEVAIVEEDMFC